MLPGFVIIGAQKSASTFVHLCLAEHPDVFMPPGETPFFEDPDYLESDIVQFEKSFSGVPKDKTLGIKRPSYLGRPEVPERIHRHIPNAKLIAVLRNPIERAVAGYFHLMRYSFIPIRPVEEGLTEIVDGRHRDPHPKRQEIVEYGFYHRHLTRYLQYFDRNQFHVALYDDVQKDPLGFIQQMYGFLGIDTKYVPRSLNARPQKDVYSLTRLRLLVVRNPLVFKYSKDRTRVYPKKRGPWGGLINRAVTMADRLLLSHVCRDSKPVLSLELKRKLYEVYENDITGLEAMLNRKLTSWKQIGPDATGDH